jgi:FkbM family methyltransferase
VQNSVKVRNGYQIALDEYGIPGESCYWLEMDHDYERVPDYQTIFDLYLKTYHWDKWIKPGMTCIDIGGHSGDTAIPMMVQCRSTVLTVEPNPVILPYIKYNCGINRHLGKFIVATQAVTNQTADNLVFGDHQNGMCNGGILGDAWDSETAKAVKSMTGSTITVSGMTLEDMCDQYLTQDEIANIGFIKTDTEGHDIEIIRSSCDFLSKHKPVLFTEWFFAYSDRDTAELFQVINKAGYVAHYPTTMQPADPNIRSDDLVCIHKDNL